mmetsp:Transcript_64020/g.152671  ORF Transcript_64020/g.152671 Transcript_64020/m.152671 type:complete len:627 (+) Transcript_64020:81-1961(+)
MAAHEQTHPQKYVDDGTRELLSIIESDIDKLERFVEREQVVSRAALAKFVWSMARKVRAKIHPATAKKADAAQKWADAKGMLKDIIDFDKFNAGMYREDCVQVVVEKKVLQVLKRYKTFVETGEVETRRPAPKLLGETDQILCVDKPINYTCEYGGKDKPLPEISKCLSASALLNSESKTVQIHEYLARKYNYETAIRTREFWESGVPQVPCFCGMCSKCADYQSGCCNRLDRETSGVMVVAKTSLGFPEIRGQFSSENQHSMSHGGIEKYYLALAHGSVTEPDGGRGVVNVAEVWHPMKMRAYAEGDPELKTDQRGNPYWPNNGQDMRPMWAQTYYEPVAWYTSKDGKTEFTLLRIQIITGRRHQIRFHCAEIGYPLVSDPKYGAPKEDFELCGRMFLHSYQTRFREPFTQRWFQATSPLPEELGKVIASLKRVRSNDRNKALPLLTRRSHDLEPVLKMYDPSASLLQQIALDDSGQVVYVTEPPKEAEVPNPEPAHKKQKITVPLFNANSVPQTPPSPKDASKAPARTQEMGHAPGVQTLPRGPEPAPPSAEKHQPQQPPASNGWRRMESRKQPGVYYYFKEATGETRAEPPEPWEIKRSRNDPNVMYYWNPETGETSGSKPEM